MDVVDLIVSKQDSKGNKLRKLYSVVMKKT